MRKLGVRQIEVCQGEPLQLQGLQGSLSGDEGGSFFQNVPPFRSL